MAFHNAHAAKIVDGVVTQIIVIPHLDDDDDKITQYCNEIGLHGRWLDCSYNGTRRGKYPKIGDIYNAKNDRYESAENE